MTIAHSRYLDIAAALRTRIRSGEWEPGANLPRMKDLAIEFGANRDTVGRAIAVLESEGLVWAVPRRGTIVRHGLLRRRRMRGNLAVVTHGLVVRDFVERHVGLGGLEAPVAWPNTSLTIVGSEPPPSIEVLNCVKHLDEPDSARARSLGRA